MKTILSFIFALMISSLAEASTIQSGSVEWQAESTKGLVKISGEGGTPVGSAVVGPDGKASGTFSVVLSEFKTGIDLRDEHMRNKYLEVAKFPKATLVLDPVAVSAADFGWTGQLTLKGVTKPVKGTARVKGTDLWAEFAIVLDDFAIGVPSWLEVTMAKNVTVTVKGKLSP